MDKKMLKGRMKSIQSIQAEIPFRKWVSLALVVNVSIVLAIFLFKRFLPPEVPLFYGLPKGQEQLGNIFLLALPCTISLGIIFLNILVGFWVKDNFLLKSLVLSGLIMVFFSAITTLKIIFLVGSF